MKVICDLFFFYHTVMIFILPFFSFFFFLFFSFFFFLCILWPFFYLYISYSPFFDISLHFFLSFESSNEWQSRGASHTSFDSNVFSYLLQILMNAPPRLRPVTSTPTATILLAHTAVLATLGTLVTGKHAQVCELGR